MIRWIKTNLKIWVSISKCADITAKQQQRGREAFAKIRSEFTKTTEAHDQLYRSTRQRTLFTNFSQTNPKSLIRPVVYKYAADSWIPARKGFHFIWTGFLDGRLESFSLDRFDRVTWLCECPPHFENRQSQLNIRAIESCTLCKQIFRTWCEIRN